MFQAVGISEASPAWQDYVDYIDAIVLDGLKQTCLKAYKAFLNHLVDSNMDQVTVNSCKYLDKKTRVKKDSHFEILVGKRALMTHSEVM